MVTKTEVRSQPAHRQDAEELRLTLTIRRSEIDAATSEQRNAEADLARLDREMEGAAKDQPALLSELLDAHEAAQARHKKLTRTIDAMVLALPILERELERREADKRLVAMREQAVSAASLATEVLDRFDAFATVLSEFRQRQQAVLARASRDEIEMMRPVTDDSALARWIQIRLLKAGVTLRHPHEQSSGYFAVTEGLDPVAHARQLVDVTEAFR